MYIHIYVYMCVYVYICVYMYVCISYLWVSSEVLFKLYFEIYVEFLLFSILFHSLCLIPMKTNMEDLEENLHINHYSYYRIPIFLYLLFLILYECDSDYIIQFTHFGIEVGIGFEISTLFIYYPFSYKARKLGMRLKCN